MLGHGACWTSHLPVISGSLRGTSPCHLHGRQTSWGLPGAVGFAGLLKAQAGAGRAWLLHGPVGDAEHSLAGLRPYTQAPGYCPLTTRVSTWLLSVLRPPHRSLAEACCLCTQHSQQLLPVAVQPWFCWPCLVCGWTDSSLWAQSSESQDPNTTVNIVAFYKMCSRHRKP